MEKVKEFLLRQKKALMELDKAEGLTLREQSGYDFSLVNPETGERKGAREIIYDNTIKWLLQEANGSLFKEFVLLERKGDKLLETGELLPAIDTFTTSLLPAVRRVFSRLLSMELVSVQPLTSPSGYIFWIDHLFGTAYATESISQGDKMYLKHPKDYATSSKGGTVRDVSFQLKKKLVDTTNKKLRAVWTLEDVQDLNSQYKLDLWAEMLPALSDEIQREIDAGVIAALYAGVPAGNTVVWYHDGAGDTATWTEKEAYNKTLYDAILQAATKVYNKKYVFPNWILCSGDTFTRLSKLEKFAADPNIKADQTTEISWRYEGTLGGKFKVYVDPWFTNDKILIGYRGTDWKYAVGFYAPYIPVFLSEEYVINDDFSQRARGAMSRYAAGIIAEDENATTTNGLALVSIEATPGP